MHFIQGFNSFRVVYRVLGTSQEGASAALVAKSAIQDVETAIN